MEQDKPVRLLRNRNYMTLFVGQLLSNIGSNVFSFALLWDMKVLTNNTFMMSLVGIGWMLPQVILGPFAGVFVDRWNKRLTMFWSDAIRLMITALITALAFAHALNPVELIVTAFLLNSVGTVFGPAAGALTPLIVGQEQLASANGLEQASGPLSNILGPAISAGLIAWQGVSMAYAVNSVGFLISVLTLLVIRVGEPDRKNAKLNGKVFFGEMAEGFKIVRTVRLLMALLPVAFILNMVFAPMDLYFIQYVTVALHRTQVALGEMNSTFAVGMMAGAIAAGFVSKWVRAGYLIAGGILLSNVAMMTVGLISFFPAVIGLMFLIGLLMSLVNVPLFTMMQKLVPHEFRGRVFSLIGTLFGGAMPVGLLLGGVAAHAFPIREVIVWSSVFSGLLGLLLFTLRTVRQSDPRTPVQETIELRTDTIF